MYCVRHCAGTVGTVVCQSRLGVRAHGLLKRGCVPRILPNPRRINGRTLSLCSAQQYGSSRGSGNSYSWMLSAPWMGMQKQMTRCPRPAGVLLCHMGHPFIRSNSLTLKTMRRVPGAHEEKLPHALLNAKLS